MPEKKGLKQAMRTQLGEFPIGFRRGWGSWQHQSVSGLAMWAAEAGFEFLDLMNVAVEDIHAVESCGVKIGTIDLLHYGRLLSTDEEVRRTTTVANLEMIPKLASMGVKQFFACLMGDPSRSRLDNFRMATDVLNPLCHAAAQVNATISIEGFPGSAPNYLGIGCTPETVRGLLRAIPEGLTLNFDPSHLIRQGIEPNRFLREFISHVGHVHAKDTKLAPESIYEFGLYQDSTFEPLSPARRYAGHTWSYRLPGRGESDWKQILSLLVDNGYAGGISVELEDEDFLGTEQLEKGGLIASRDFIANIH
jgi:sugar phosphate isomerase/epimerase